MPLIIERHILTLMIYRIIRERDIFASIQAPKPMRRK